MSMELQTKIEKNTAVVYLVLDRIQNAILKGELKAGDKLPTEQELVENLGVGRYSIREAIKMLVALGVLEIRRADGTYIVDEPSPQMIDPLIYCLLVSNKSASDLLDIRAFFERSFLELAVERATEEEIRELEDFHNTIKGSILDDCGYQEIIDLDVAFHMAVAKAAKSPLMERMYDMFFKVYTQAFNRMDKESYATSLVKHHSMIVDLIKNRIKDSNYAKEVISGSLEIWSKSI